MNTTERVCGDFEEPTNPDLGQCVPYRLKLDCIPVPAPVPECGETDFVIEYDPDGFGFRVLSKIFDENCLPVLDENSLPILSYTK